MISHDATLLKFFTSHHNTTFITFSSHNNSVSINLTHTWESIQKWTKFNFLKAAFHNFTWFIPEYFVPHVVLIATLIAVLTSTMNLVTFGHFFSP